MSWMRYHRFTNVRGTATVENSASGGHYRSKLERDGFITWMLNPEVAQARLQKPRVKNSNSDGSWKRYTGDLLVDFHPKLQRRQLVIEFKYAKELAHLKKTEPKRYLEIAAYLDSQKRDFLIQTEEHVYAAGFPMMRFVWDHRNKKMHPASQEIIAYVRANPGVSLGVMLGILRIERIARLELIPEVWRLVSTHHLSVDFKKVLDQSAKLHPGSV